MKIFLLLLAVCVGITAHAQYTITGTVVDANGKPPVAADVHISPFADDLLVTTYPLLKNGSFEVSVPHGGYYYVRISAPDHREIKVPIFIRETEKEAAMQVRLQANSYATTFGRVRIIGDWNNFKFSGVDTMVRAGNTYTYTLTATADTLSYQLLDIDKAGHSVNGTHNDYYAYDGGGDYRSVLRTKPGQQVTITFDPEKLRALPPGSVGEVKPLRSRTNYYALHAKMNEMAKARLQASGESTKAMEETRYQEIVDYLRNELTSTDDESYRQFAAVLIADQYNPSLPFDKSLAKQVLDAVPARSPVWAVSPMALPILCKIVGQDATAYMNDAAEHNESATVRAIIFADRLSDAYTAKDMQKARELYTMLKRDYGTVAQIKYSLMQFNPDAVVQVGKHVPAFDLELLGTTTKVSNTSMEGKYYMIDFWATWCGPCVREMPAIHKAYERFKGRKGFEILSISMDGSEKQIAPFRKKWEMPWMHVFIPGVFDNDVARKFEVAGIPKPILVDARGEIVAMQDELRGESLEATLEKFLGGEN